MTPRVPRGILEIGVAGLLLAADLVLAGSVGLEREALILGIAACLGAALCGFRLYAGTGIVGLCLIGFILVAPSPIGAAEHAILVPVASAMAQGRRRFALLASVVFIALEGVVHTVRHGKGVGDLVMYTFLWLVMFAIAALVGTAIHLSRVAEGLRVEAAHAARRRQIVADLHTSAAHKLALLALVADRAATNPETHQESLVEIAGTARIVSRDLREVMSVLLSPMDPPHPSTKANLAEAVRRAGSRLTKSGFEVTTFIDGPIDSVPLEISTALGVVVVEAANNIERHGGRSQPVALLLEVDMTAVELLLSNRHSGNPVASPVDTRFGLAGIRDAIESVGGDLDLVATGNLWTLRATVPLRKD